MNKSREAFRTISEVSDWLETPAHVLRFWESKFSQIRPVKGAGGRRYYRPEDMALLGGIKFLLHEQGMTIKGAQKLLREQGLRYVASLGPQPFADDPPAPAPALHAVLAPAPVAAAQAVPVSPTPSAVLAMPALDLRAAVAAPVVPDVAEEAPAAAFAADVVHPDMSGHDTLPVTAAILSGHVAHVAPDSAPVAQSLTQALAQRAESMRLGAGIAQDDATADEESSAALPADSVDAAEDAPEIAPDSAPVAQMTLRRPINEILMHALMLGQDAPLRHRESLAALANRLHDARSRISIE